MDSIVAYVGDVSIFESVLQEPGTTWCLMKIYSQSFIQHVPRLWQTRSPSKVMCVTMCVLFTDQILPQIPVINTAISQSVEKHPFLSTMFNLSPFPSRLRSSQPVIGASCPNAMAFWKCEANSHPLTFRNFCHVFF